MQWYHSRIAREKGEEYPDISLTHSGCLECSSDHNDKLKRIGHFVVAFWLS